MSSNLDQSMLDQSQKIFCQEPQRAVRLLAPAGSGKTLSLLWRCSSLQESASEDEKLRFLIFTFTRTARDELRDRLKSDSSFNPIKSNIEITTLNAWGYRRLKSKLHSLRICNSNQDKYLCVNNILQPVWKKYDKVKSTIESTKAKGRVAKAIIDLMDDLKGLGFRHDQYGDLDSLLIHMSWIFENGMGAHLVSIINRLKDLEIIQNVEKPYAEIHEHFMKFWCEACHHMFESSFITLEDQKYWALIDLDNMIKDNKYTTGMHRYQHILVDEFQDINALDLNLLSSIASINKSQLTIVGDDDQAIYEWRGATPEFILKPGKYFETDYKTCILDVNYRSPRNIVSHSQQLIKHNKKRVVKTVKAFSTFDAEIQVLQMPTLTHSVNYVLNTVREMLDSTEIQKVAIIGRKRSQIIPYQIIFASNNIPFYAAEDLHIFLSDAFSELKELLAIKARAGASGLFAPEPVTDLLKLCDKVKRFPINKHERASLKRFLFSHHPKSLLDAIGAFHLYQGSLKGCKDNSRILDTFCESINSLIKAETVADAIDSISRNFDGLQRDYGKAMDDIFYTDPPFLYLSEYAVRYGNDYVAFYQDIEKAIATLARIIPEDENKTDDVDESWKLPLHLMTALRAKGKEYDAVIILDANQGIWPSKLAETENELEQERRVFYVASTRARKRLYLLVNESILGEPALPSQYIEEMGLAIQNNTHSIK